MRRLLFLILICHSTFAYQRQCPLLEELSLRLPSQLHRELHTMIKFLMSPPMVDHLAKLTRLVNERKLAEKRAQVGTDFNVHLDFIRARTERGETFSAEEKQWLIDILNLPELFPQALENQRKLVLSFAEKANKVPAADFEKLFGRLSPVEKAKVTSAPEAERLRGERLGFIRLRLDENNAVTAKLNRTLPLSEGEKKHVEDTFRFLSPDKQKLQPRHRQSLQILKTKWEHQIFTAADWQNLQTLIRSFSQDLLDELQKENFEDQLIYDSRLFIENMREFPSTIFKKMLNHQYLTVAEAQWINDLVMGGIIPDTLPVPPAVIKASTRLSEALRPKPRR